MNSLSVWPRPSVLHSALSTELLLIPSAELSALVEVKQLKWHRGRLLRAQPSKWEPFNKSLAINIISSFEIAVKKPRACGTQSCTVVSLG